jgi:hypothetical protein
MFFDHVKVVGANDATRFCRVNRDVRRKNFGKILVAFRDQNALPTHPVPPHEASKAAHIRRLRFSKKVCPVLAPFLQ